jgi:hypothetical protein
MPCQSHCQIRGKRRIKAGLLNLPGHVFKSRILRIYMVTGLMLLFASVLVRRYGDVRKAAG